MNANAPLSTLQSTRSRAFLLIGLLLAFALRLYHLGGESLWYDETVSAVLADGEPPPDRKRTAQSALDDALSTSINCSDQLPLRLTVDTRSAVDAVLMPVVLPE